MPIWIIFPLLKTQKFKFPIFVKLVKGKSFCRHGSTVQAPSRHPKKLIALIRGKVLFPFFYSNSYKKHSKGRTAPISGHGIVMAQAPP